MNKIIIISIALLIGTSCQGQKTSSEAVDKEQTKTEKKMDSRDILMQRITNGYDTIGVENNESKSILARGCDPEMGKRSVEVLPDFLGNPEMVSVYNDVDFIEKLKSRKWTVIFFAPGACRYDANNMNIPGSGGLTEGWGIDEYKELVKKYQGDDIQIVETIDEDQIINLLRSSLLNK